MPTSPVRNILYIEDDMALARLLQKRMERKNYNIDLAPTAEEGLAKLHEKKYDLILLDYNLPGMNGIDLLDKLAPMNAWPPVIILTASGDERMALDALERGAADYAVKDAGQLYLDLLPAVMQAAYTKDRLMRENEFQRQELEKEKEKAESANRAKSDFLATMSHEIRTPMNAVVGLATLLQDTPLNEKQQHMVSMLSTNADLLLKLINNLLDLSRIEAGQIELELSTFSFADVLKEIQSIFAMQMADKQLSFTINDRTGAALFQGDRTRVQQIVLNLVANAYKFTDRGSVQVTAEKAKDENGRTMVQVRVQDTGIGIPPEKLTHIFDKFAQADQSISRRFGGSGLGLAISQRLSRLMDGDITVESTVGNGSTFTAHWHLREMAPIHIASFAETAAALRPDAPRDNCVLLVEDYPANAMVATLMLESLGYTVELANCGKLALEKIEQATTPYTAILMDVQMGDMDGYEATQRIRALEKVKGFRHPIIGVTAHALAGDRERCIDAGMDDYMSKPIHPDIIAQKLSALNEPDFLTAL